MDVKVGDEIQDCKLGIWASLSVGDNTEREEIAAKGGLSDKEKEIFARVSLKVAEGKDPEDARDRISSLITKATAFISS